MKSKFLKMIVPVSVVLGTIAFLLLVNIGYIFITNTIYKKSRYEMDLLEKCKLILIQNRLALTNINKLDVAAQLFYEEKQSFFLQISGSYDDLNSLAGLNKNNTYISQASTIFTTQKQLLQKAIDFDAIVKNIYLYDAQSDLNVDSLDELILRLSSAKNGLDVIYSGMQKDFPEVPILSEIEAIQDELSVYIESPELLNKDELSQLFLKLKDSTFNQEKKLIYSKDLVDVIANETNLIINIENEYAKK